MMSLRECDGDLVNHWYIAALSKELKPNQVIARTLYGRHYALFRDPKGTAHALEDRCLHRGTKLSEGHCGPKGLSCPYHGWTYNSEGLVVDVPSEEKKESIPSRLWKAPNAPVHEQDGVLWLWTGSSPSTSPPPWRFPYAEDSSWNHYFMVTDFKNEVTHLVQNFMDVPHTVFVHKKWFRDKKMLKVPYTLEVTLGRVKATYEQPHDSIGGVLNWLLNPYRKHMVHTDEFIFPNITRVDYRFDELGFIINSQCTPIDRYSTRVYTWITYKGHFIARFLQALMHSYTRKVIEQDVEIMKNQGDNLQRYEGRQDFKSTAADEVHLAISSLREAGVLDRHKALLPQFKKERVFWI